MATIANPTAASSPAPIDARIGRDVTSPARAGLESIANGECPHGTEDYAVVPGRSTDSPARRGVCEMAGRTNQ